MKSEINPTRRTFLKTLGLASAGFTLVPRHVLGGPGYVAPSDKLRVAGIGAGGKGEHDMKKFFDSGKADIVAMCDVDDRQAVESRKRFPKATYYKDYRQMLEKEAKNIDAVSVSTPDHCHAVQAMAAMQLGKHVYVQKPLAHDVYEARMLTEAAKKYKVVTQMGNQGSSGDGVRTLREWYDADQIGDVHTVYCWTNRPVWPQGIAWPKEPATVPTELDWNLWLNTAPQKDYVNGLVPFNWRGWWDYGTGALGDMGCHIIEPAFSVLGLGYPQDVTASVGSVYTGPFRRGYFPDSGPPSSHVIFTFPARPGKLAVKLHWMDGGIQPERPEELGPNEPFGDSQDPGNGVLFIGTKGRMTCATYGLEPKLLPTVRNNDVKVPQTQKRVPGGIEGHYAHWVEACIAGYGKVQLSSSFEIAGFLTEAVLMGNLAIRSHDIRVPKVDKPNQFDYPGRGIKLNWDGTNMRVTNFEQANQFVKRTYREGWTL